MIPHMFKNDVNITSKYFVNTSYFLIIFFKGGSFEECRSINFFWRND